MKHCHYYGSTLEGEDVDFFLTTTEEGELMWTKIRSLDIPVGFSEMYSIEECIPFFKDRIVLDIGASLGLWSAAALYTGAKQVYAFDPLPDDRIPPDSKYIRHILGIDDKVNTIDRLVKDNTITSPDFIKIDTDGDEMMVLNGALETLKNKPNMMIECHSVDNVIKIKNILGDPTKIVSMIVYGVIGDVHHMFYLNPQ